MNQVKYINFFHLKEHLRRTLTRELLKNIAEVVLQTAPKRFSYNLNLAPIIESFLSKTEKLESKNLITPKYNSHQKTFKNSLQDCSSNHGFYKNREFCSSSIY